MKTVLYAHPFVLTFADLRARGGYPAGISGCFLAADGRFTIRFGGWADKQLMYPVVNPAQKSVDELDFSADFTDVWEMKFLRDGYLVSGQKRGDHKYRFYVTDHAGRICRELRIGLSHLHACAQTATGHLLAAYRVEDQIGDIHVPHGLGCWTTDGQMVDYPHAGEFSACDFVAASDGGILVGTDDGNAVLIRENGEKIPMRIARHPSDCAAFCARTGKCIFFDSPRREGEGILFHLAQPDAAPERVYFTDGNKEIDVQYADAAGNTLLLADNERCYLYNL